MRCLIIGGGAIGLLYGAKLAIGGSQAYVCTRTASQAAILREAGIELAAQGTIRRVEVEAEAAEHIIGDRLRFFAAEAVLLTVKQYQLTGQLLDCLERAVLPGTPVYCLQNGIGHLELLRGALPQLTFRAAVTTDGALRTGLNAVKHTGAGELWLEAADSNLNETERQKMLVSTMKKAGIAVFLSKQMKDRMYRKLLLNSVINPLTALYGVKNGELPEAPDRLAHMKLLYDETAAILHAAGMELRGDEWEQVLALCRLTADNESSMLRDVRSGRQTEIDWINGGVAALARRLGLTAPHNEEITARIAPPVSDR
ncbi:ketopantoate reductase family protein [Paenibacillus sp. 1P07SE]|uniref:ketopantoate reductase family protein n=1 Tax=Paenibacillus sp. 1P07SE TaxID=3132209 RepID=UPI0039A4E642